MDSGGADLDNIRSLESKGGHHNEEKDGLEVEKNERQLSKYDSYCVVLRFQAQCHVQPPKERANERHFLVNQV